jgi:phosphatidylserine/phosphatidylglycerophosphate/cardiolipin synthase-like enzyme
MSPQEFDTILSRTLADRRLTGSERDALVQVFAGEHLDDNRRSALRHRVFELARQEMLTEDAKQVLGWVEEVVKLLLTPATRPSTATHSEAYFSPHDDCTGRIIRLFGEARATADLCVFTITDDRLSDALLAAHRRGVRLRIITDNDKAHDLGSDIERFRAAGIAVREDRTPFHMHHKYAIFDGKWLLNGSFNWTRGAARDNQENIVVTNDANLLSMFAGAFERLWGELE